MTSISPIYELLRADGSIIINKALIFSIGLEETIIFFELISRYKYFEERNMLTEEGFFYNTVDDLQLATGLSEKKQKSAITKLEKFKLIETKLMGVPAKRHFKIIDDMVTVLMYIQEGKTKIEALKKSLEEKMKAKIEMKKLKENKDNTTSEGKKEGVSSSAKTEELPISNSSAKTEELVPPDESNKFQQNDGASSDILDEQVPPIQRRNNTHNNTYNNINNNIKKENFFSVAPNEKDIWNSIEIILKNKLTDVAFNTWIKGTVVDKHIINGCLELTIINEFSQNVLKSRYKALIEDAYKVVYPNQSSHEVVFKIE